MSYTYNKGMDQPAHPLSLISDFVVRYLDSPSIPEIPRPQQASAVEQAALSPTSSHTPKTYFLVNEQLSLPVSTNTNSKISGRAPWNGQ